ncbi:hypothetical protein AVEN_25916-1 [Araneus ventricosus]|uniref:Uncharacterized protein n=1 Tax=Araneus ventricosus TaxID=182803 RepID=A0A4Y2U0S6_ARAVE|nr:hypothetical protein AVEN_25916-1 [Araneus ventricosus]
MKRRCRVVGNCVPFTLCSEDDEKVDHVLGEEKDDEDKNDDTQTKKDEKNKKDDTQTKKVMWKEADEGLQIFLKFLCLSMSEHYVMKLHCIHNEFSKL